MVSKVLLITELYGLRLTVDSYVAQKDLCNAIGNTLRNYCYAPRCTVCGDSHFSLWVF